MNPELYYSDCLLFEKVPLFQENIFFYVSYADGKYILRGITQEGLAKLDKEPTTRAKKYYPVTHYLIKACMDINNIFKMHNGQIVYSGNFLGEKDRPKPLLAENSLFQYETEEKIVDGNFVYQMEENENGDIAYKLDENGKKVPVLIEKIVLATSPIEKNIIENFLKVSLSEIKEEDFEKRPEEFWFDEVQPLEVYLSVPLRQALERQAESVARSHLLRQRSSLEALNEHLITPGQAVNAPLELVELMLSENGQCALQSFTSFSAVTQTPINCLKLLLEDDIISDAQSGELNWFALKDFDYDRLKLILEEGRQMLDLLPEEELLELNYDQLKFVFTTPAGYKIGQALNKKVITIEVAKQLSIDELKCLITIIDKKMVTINEIRNLSSDQIQILLKKPFFKVFIQKLVTLNDIKRLDLHALEQEIARIDRLPSEYELHKEALFSPNGIAALIRGLISMEEAISLPIMSLNLLLREGGNNLCRVNLEELRAFQVGPKVLKRTLEDFRFHDIFSHSKELKVKTEEQELLNSINFDNLHFFNSIKQGTLYSLPKEDKPPLKQSPSKYSSVTKSNILSAYEDPKKNSKRSVKAEYEKDIEDIENIDNNTVSFGNKRFRTAGDLFINGESKSNSAKATPNKFQEEDTKNTSLRNSFNGLFANPSRNKQKDEDQVQDLVSSPLNH